MLIAQTSSTYNIYLPNKLVNALLLNYQSFDLVDHLYIVQCLIEYSIV